MSRIYLLLFTAFTALPAYAQAPQNYEAIVRRATNVLSLAIPVIVSLTLLIFFWGLIKFVRSSAEGNGKEVEEGKQMMVWSIIGLFVVVALSGIIGLLVNSFFSNIEEQLPTPTQQGLNLSPDNFR